VTCGAIIAPVKHAPKPQRVAEVRLSRGEKDAASALVRYKSDAETITLVNKSG
jgi:hypothetical protein